jgi:hypothetical protein
MNLDVVQRRRFLATGNALDANFVAGMKSQMLDPAARCRIAA